MWFKKLRSRNSVAEEAPANSEYVPISEAAIRLEPSPSRDEAARFRLSSSSSSPVKDFKLPPPSSLSDTTGSAENEQELAQCAKMSPAMESELWTRYKILDSKYDELYQIYQLEQQVRKQLTDDCATLREELASVKKVPQSSVSKGKLTSALVSQESNLPVAAAQFVPLLQKLHKDPIRIELVNWLLNTLDDLESPTASYPPATDDLAKKENLSSSLFTVKTELSRIQDIATSLEKQKADVVTDSTPIQSLLAALRGYADSFPSWRGALEQIMSELNQLLPGLQEHLLDTDKACSILHDYLFTPVTVGFASKNGHLLQEISNDMSVKRRKCAEIHAEIASLEQQVSAEAVAKINQLYHRSDSRYLELLQMNISRKQIIESREGEELCGKLSSAKEQGCKILKDWAYDFQKQIVEIDSHLRRLDEDVDLFKSGQGQVLSLFEQQQSYLHGIKEELDAEAARNAQALRDILKLESQRIHKSNHLQLEKDALRRSYNQLLDDGENVTVQQLSAMDRIGSFRTLNSSRIDLLDQTRSFISNTISTVTTYIRQQMADLRSQKTAIHLQHYRDCCELYESVSERLVSKRPYMLALSTDVERLEIKMKHAALSHDSVSLEKCQSKRESKVEQLKSVQAEINTLEQILTDIDMKYQLPATIEELNQAEDRVDSDYIHPRTKLVELEMIQLKRELELQQKERQIYQKQVQSVEQRLASLAHALPESRESLGSSSRDSFSSRKQARLLNSSADSTVDETPLVLDGNGVVIMSPAEGNGFSSAFSFLSAPSDLDNSVVDSVDIGDVVDETAPERTQQPVSSVSAFSFIQASSASIDSSLI